MTLTEILTSAIQETATAVPDPEHGERFLAVEGTVDVGGLAALALDYAAHLVDTYRVQSGTHFGRTVPAFNYETRDRLTELAKEARA